jgi:dUTP pyrophosphatase
MSEKIGIQKLHPDAVIPEYANFGDAGLDLVAIAPETLQGGQRALVGTGLAIAIPLGFAGFIMPRSGLALKHGITVLNAPGVIDAGYRGEIKVLLHNTDVRSYIIAPGDRIAQLVLAPVAWFRLHEVRILPKSERGTGGFGSTGS